MDKKPSLKAIFESNKSLLAEKINRCILPKDSKIVEKEVSLFFNGLLSEEGDFRLSLTQGEDYLLQATTSLLEAQKKMGSALLAKTPIELEQTTPDTSTPHIRLYKEDLPKTIGATTVGGVVGGLTLGTWGAVVGSIAGTALILYYAYQQPYSKSCTPQKSKVAPSCEETIDIDEFFNIIGKICESIDSLITTFRQQIKSVVERYNNQPKPTLEKNFSSLLETIQSLVGYMRTHSTENEKYVPRLQQRVEDVVDILDNYDLEVLDYSEENQHFFETVESPNTETAKMVLPAIIKGTSLVLKGKVFIPCKK